MTLVIAQITIPLLGFIALNDIITGKVDKKVWLNGLKWAFIITGGLTLLFAVAPGMTGDFSSPYDLRLKLPDWLIETAVADRKSALRSDAFRSFIFIVLGCRSFVFMESQKNKNQYFNC